MICHLFSFLQKRRVRTAARLPPLRPRLFVLSYLLGLERGGEGRGHFLFIRVDVKRENGQFKVELLVS